MTDFEKERTAAEKLAEANHTVPGPAAVSGNITSADSETSSGEEGTPAPANPAVLLRTYSRGRNPQGFPREMGGRGVGACFKRRVILRASQNFTGLEKIEKFTVNS